MYGSHRTDNVQGIEKQLLLVFSSLFYAVWFISVCDHLQNNCSDSIKKCFCITVINGIFLEELEPEGPFVDLQLRHTDYILSKFLLFTVRMRQTTRFFCLS